MRSIRQIKNLKGKKVLVRVDFNVPIKNGRILDDFRIKKALPTIKFLEKKGAKIILITHLGKNGNESLAPIIKRFFEISKCVVRRHECHFSAPKQDERPCPLFRQSHNKEKGLCLSNQVAVILYSFFFA